MKQGSKKPSSAPARISAKDDIWKEIHDWAKPSGARGSAAAEGGDSDGGQAAAATDQTAMIGAQLKDNVTEQRMLEGRLMDLSKERYKFIVQVAWQRKAFVDRQRAKTGVMRDLLAGVDTSAASAGSGGKKNHGARMRARHEAYRGLVRKTYGEETRRERAASLPGTGGGADDGAGLLEMRPIFPRSAPAIFKTEVTSSSRSPSSPPGGGPQRGGSHPGGGGRLRKKADRRGRVNAVSFPSIQPGAAGSGPVTRSQGLITQRQSLPASFLRRDAHHQRAATVSSHSKPGGEAGRETRSAGAGIAAAVPKCLRYRTVFDGRFDRLQKVLCQPYTGSRMDSMSSLLRTLPTPAPAPSPAATPVATSSA